MTQTRIYLPLTAADLDSLVRSGEVATSVAFAVTPALRSDLPSGAEEEREHLALTDATTAAGELRAGRTLEAGDGRTGRRVVAAADVDPSAVVITPARPGSPRSVVGLRGPVPLRRIVSFHLDEHPGGEEGLLWYDVTELTEVARLLA